MNLWCWQGVWISMLPDKAARFIRTCDAFEIPLLTLEDVPGYLPGKARNMEGSSGMGQNFYMPMQKPACLKLRVITRKAYGGAYIGMGSKLIWAQIMYLPGPVLK